MTRGSMKCTLLILAAIGALGLEPGHATAADKVTFVTDFGYNGRHAYYFVALDKGYYAKQNLDVDIVRGQGSANAVKQVASGTAQLGFADTSVVILGRGNDQIPTKLVAIVYAKSPLAIYVLKDSGITKPKDLEGKKLADTAFSAVPKLFAAYAQAAHIDANRCAAGDAHHGPRRRHRPVHGRRAAASQGGRAEAGLCLVVRRRRT
jgi:ABC-type nitrate/sulfonate/bicarbonate transport system substrate-binding protein